jgi:16S rRNA (cytidine1402-2'-O)-methyltransferase
VFYESPHKILKTLKDLAEAFGGDRDASISREITKLHEETIRGTLDELVEVVEQRTLKGEIVLTVAGLSKVK